jgi:hypothetical protein
MKQNLEIELRPGVNAFEVQKYLNGCKYVKCNVVECNKIRVWFNPSRIADKRVLKLVAAATKKPNERRGKANVAHLRNITETKPAA